MKPTRTGSRTASLRPEDDAFRQLFAANPNPMWVFEHGTMRFLAVNDAAISHYGYSRDEFLGMTLRDIRPPGEIGHLLEYAGRSHPDVAKGGFFRHRRKNGEIIDVDITAHAIDFGGCEAWMVMAHDVSALLEMKEALLNSEQQLAFFIENAPAPLAMFDRDMKYLTASRRWLSEYRLAGLEALRGRSHYEIFPEIGEDWREMHRRGLQGEVLRRDEEIFRRADGTEQWLRWEVMPWHTPRKEIGGIVIYSEDISARKLSEAALRQSAVVFESTRDGVLITDLTPRIVAINRAYSEITGYEPEEVVGLNPNVLQSGRHGRDFYQALWRSVKETGTWTGEIWNRRKNGELYPQLLTISIVCDPQGEPSNYVGVFTDLSKLKQSEERLEHLSHFDPLTDLPNRLLAYSRLEFALAGAQQAGMRVAVLFLDIDRFKNINDSLGLTVGDELLADIAGRLRKCISRDDTLARLGGDEFLAILHRIENPTEAASAARALLDVFDQPFMLDGREVHLTASVGISVFPDDSLTTRELIQHADLAMFMAKQQGRNTFQFHAEELTRTVRENLLLETSMRPALREGQFVLHYQPCVELGTRRHIGVEALIRWFRPGEGMVRPDKFIRVAEESGFILQLGEWILRSACAQGSSWLRAGLQPFVIAVNISARQFHAPDFVESVEAALAESGFPPRYLELEVTESMLMEPVDQAIATLTRLRAAGIRIAIDDFGTGYSSLAYLKRFPISKLKIDQSFVANLEAGGIDREITAAIIALAASLRLEVLAEGVETEGQRAVLEAQGCHVCQGYLFSEPMPAVEAEVWLKQHES